MPIKAAATRMNRSLAVFQNKLQQPFHAVGRLIRLDAQLLKRKMKAIDPIGRVAETFGSVGIPAPKGREEDLFLFKMKMAHPQSIGGGFRFISRIGLGTQEFIKEILDPGALRIVVKHL